MISNLQHREPGQSHVSKAARSALIVDGFDGRLEYGGIARKQQRKLLALLQIAIQGAEIFGYFLEAEYVGIRELCRNGNRPRQIDDSIAALSALDIPGDQ
jgi:hypothetical protein